MFGALPHNRGPGGPTNGGLAAPGDDRSHLDQDATYMAAAALLRANEGQLDGRPDGQLDGKAFLNRLFGQATLSLDGRTKDTDRRPRGSDHLAVFKRWVEKAYGPGSFEQIVRSPELLAKALVDFASDPTVGGPSQRGGGGRDGYALGAQAKVREFLADGGLGQDPMRQWTLNPAEFGDTLKNGFDGDAIQANGYWRAILENQTRRQNDVSGREPRFEATF